MKKNLLVLPILFSILLLSTACSSKSKIDFNSIVLPIISLEGSEDTITPAFYENGFDFNYDSLPVLTLSNKDALLLMELSDYFESNVEIGEDYYTYTNSAGICKKETYTLTKADNNVVTLSIGRRGNVRDEVAIYYMKNDEGTFVFKVIFPIDENL